MYNPSPQMRRVQYRIVTELLDKAFKIPDYIYAFERDRSIPVMAKVHEGALKVVSLDIENFFPSIKQNRIFSILVERGFGEKPARTLSELMTFGPFVPQGAITSPKISNIVAAETFGPVVKEFCDERGLALTIYADDITISSKQDFDSNEVIAFVSGALARFRFKVNTAKTKVMKKGTRNSRLYVCGAVVNDKVNLIRSERLKLRAIVHNCEVNGIDAEASKNALTPAEFMAQVRGRLNWFRQLNPEKASPLVDRFKGACDVWSEKNRSVPYQYVS